MRYFFHVGYNGYNYRGWQKFPQIASIQQVLETCLSQVLKTPIEIVGCGRTDAQVHASQFFFHVDLDHSWDFDLLFRINKNLPPDIAVFDIIPVEGLRHARFDATSRTYDYFIHTYKDPFLSGLSTLYARNLDLDKMKAAVLLLSRYNDFRAYCKSPAKYRNTICHVSSARLLSDGTGDHIRLQISANRFLSSMIRIIMGKLLKIGIHELSVEEFEHYLITKEIPRTLEQASPHGLYLSKVVYPFLDIPARAKFSSFQPQADRWQAV